MERIIHLELIEDHVTASIGLSYDLKCDLATKSITEFTKLHHSDDWGCLIV